MEIDSKVASELVAFLNQLKEEAIIDSAFEIVNQNVLDFTLEEPCDVVLMNPPYGTKTENIDSKFLEKACALCRGNVYSLHKSATREVRE